MRRVYDGTTYQDRFIIQPNGNTVIGGAPFSNSNKLTVMGEISFSPAGGGVFNVCVNNGAPGEPGRQLAACSSSIRYKQNVRNYTPGLDLIRRLRPVSFNWKSNNLEDLGLIAEETAEIEPLLTTTNDKGEVEGVKYDRVGVVLVNAVNGQRDNGQRDNGQRTMDIGQREINNRQQT